ncbi:MAG: nucleotidyl transferase AbiEii/AbiGii toxin family protein [Deltaproteobacteria bacterium]|nr:nucleotidyl transferase AbiEii/AbiGii toxin family protein [Deltaproteobacteria bacterium]MBW2105969.1 nucleotidyl transferase AbiEii/AbiGii toxin family protein [Deltaproteobacteria bacterium]
MQDLVLQEQFEIEVLEKLNSGRLLDPLVFEGGSMLRLCYGLNRYSVDLDFSLIKEIDSNKFFRRCKDYLEKRYKIKDTANTFYTIIFELSSPRYPRSLKIEVRKEGKNVKIEEAIAFSKYSNVQVLVKTISLPSMMDLKIRSFLDRGEIRDCFDIEFLLKRGISVDVSRETLKKVLTKIEGLSKRDYTVKLGALVEENERRYYIQNNFKTLKLEIINRIGFKKIS